MLRAKSHFAVLCSAGLVAMCLQTPVASAAESIAAAGPIGGTDINGAFLPPGGLWVSSINAYVKMTRYYDNDGTPLKAKGSDALSGIGLLYAYPETFLGGQFATSLFAGYEKVCFGVEPSGENCSSGVKDLYSDVLMWSKYFPSEAAANQTGDIKRPFGTAFLMGLGVTAPVGNYDMARGINNGSNLWGFSPNIGITYTAPSPFPEAFGDAIQFNGRLFYHMYTENHATKYQTGSVISMDWAVAMMKDKWYYGLAGLSYAELEDDTIDGVIHPNHGNRSAVIGIGPIIARDFMIDNHPMNITIKGIQSVYGKNVAKSTGVFVRLSAKF